MAVFKSQTEIGKFFKLDSTRVGKILNDFGLKKDNAPTKRAIDLGICKKVNSFWLWDSIFIKELFVRDGYKIKEKGISKPRDVDFIAYTDGSDSTYAGIVYDKNGKATYICGHTPTNSSNNQNELIAVIEVLKYIPEGKSVKIFTDSTYVMRVWRKFRNEKNYQLENDFFHFSENKVVKMAWVKSHNNNKGNNEADNLASITKDFR